MKVMVASTSFIAMYSSFHFVKVRSLLLLSQNMNRKIIADVLPEINFLYYTKFLTILQY